MSKQYKHIFFDLDHTLWDFDRNSAATLERIYTEYRLDERGVSDLNTFIDHFNAHNQRMWDKFRKGHMRREELRWKRFWITLLDFQIANEMLAHELSSAYMEILPTQTLLVPYAKEALDHCREKYILHLITNGFELTQKMKIQFSGLGGYFKEMITSERSHAMKPHPTIFEYALTSTGASIAESIMIGDALEVDVLGAKDAGWDHVYYNPLKIPHGHKLTHEVACLSELMVIL